MKIAIVTDYRFDRAANDLADKLLMLRQNQDWCVGFCRLLPIPSKECEHRILERFHMIVLHPIRGLRNRSELRYCVAGVMINDCSVICGAAGGGATGGVAAAPHSICSQVSPRM